MVGELMDCCVWLVKSILTTCSMSEIWGANRFALWLTYCKLALHFKLCQKIYRQIRENEGQQIQKPERKWKDLKTFLTENSEILIKKLMEIIHSFIQDFSNFSSKYIIIQENVLVFCFIYLSLWWPTWYYVNNLYIVLWCICINVSVTFQQNAWFWMFLYKYCCLQ